MSGQAVGNKKDQPVTWEELAKVREKEKKKAEIQAKEDKDAASIGLAVPRMGKK